MLQARRFLQGYGCEGYKMREKNGCVVTCWQDRSLFSTTVWRARKKLRLICKQEGNIRKNKNMI